MVEILDETPALEDPLFVEIWDGISLKKVGLGLLKEYNKRLATRRSSSSTINCHFDARHYAKNLLSSD